MVPTLGKTPARVNRRTGVLYISKEKWEQMPENVRLFVLLHEAGHVDQQTTNEILADNYAFQAYAQSGRPLSESITALTRLLHFTNQSHYDRVNAQMRRAFAFDAHVNGNPRANVDELPMITPEANFSGAGDEQKPRSQTKWILAGAGVLVILSIIIYFTTRKR